MSAQAMAALEHANAIRLARSAVKQSVKAGTMSVGAALGEPCCASMRVTDLLMAQRRWGVEKVRKLLKWLEYRDGVVISPDRRVRSLTAREVTALSAACGSTKP
jgi:hypothetical protein